ncbi:MAG: SDR family oxidoreductase [Deltaproteobacteria bacterium]|nr:SDR family oxidoreductase [Deltaproteobacteria bacterium]MBW2417446.1 SDR family oxidoreductase [Deltaproteobacteria bacterium]
MMERALEGRTALVTGGGTGIGLGIARRLLEAGARVTLAARRSDVLEAAAEALRTEIEAAEVGTVVCDVTDEEQIAAAVAQAGDADGQLDVAVANAGSGAPGPILALAPEAWRFANDLNILGSALTIKHAGLAMQRRGGSIVAISSVEAFKIAKYMAPYTVTKAALEALVRCAALELAVFGIRVNCIQPGYVPTEALDLAFDAEDVRELVAITPLGRAGRAEQIGDAAVYFSSASGGWVTGQVLAVDGGMALPEGVSFEKLCRKIYGDEVMDSCVGPRPPRDTSAEGG